MARTAFLAAFQVMKTLHGWMLTSRDEIVLFVVFLSWALFFVSIDFNGDLPPHNNDDLTYLTVAKSFSEGRGYQNIALPVVENNFLAPSAFPIALMPYWLFLAPNVPALKVILIALLIVGVWLSNLWLRQFIPRIEAFLITLAFASLPEFIMTANSIMTEILFIPVLYLALLLTARFDRQKYQGDVGWLAMFAWLVLARTRVVGVVFLAVFLLQIVLKRQWFKAAVTIVLFAGWLYLESTWVIAAAVPRAYGHALTDWGHALVYNTHEFISTVGAYYYSNIKDFACFYYTKYLFPIFYSLGTMNPIKLAITLAVTASGMVGGIFLWREKVAMRPYIASFLVICAIIFKWDEFGALHRYLFPFYPFLALVFVYLFHLLIQKVPWLKQIRATAVICLLIAVNNGYFSAKQFNPWAEDYWDRANMKLAHDYISSLSPKPDLVISPIYLYTYLKTGIRSIPLEDTALVRKHCTEYDPGRVVVVDVHGMDMSVSGNLVRIGAWGVGCPACNQQ